MPNFQKYNVHHSGQDKEAEPQTSIIGEKFDTVEDAWFWCVSAMQARTDGARITAGQSNIVRPCEPLDIMKVVDTLYRSRRLIRDHLFVLKHYGVRHMAPDPRRNKEARAFTLWEEAMMRMETILERKGIIAKTPSTFHELARTHGHDIPDFVQNFEVPTK